LVASARLPQGRERNRRGWWFHLTSHKSCFTPRPTLQNQSLCHNIPDRSRPHWAPHVLLKERELNIPNELKKETAAVESNTLQPWHKSAPWLISAATLLGLVIIFQR